MIRQLADCKLYWMRMNPGKVPQTVRENGSVAKQVVSASRKTASAALRWPGVGMAAESSAAVP